MSRPLSSSDKCRHSHAGIFTVPAAAVNKGAWKCSPFVNSRPVARRKKPRPLEGRSLSHPVCGSRVVRASSLQASALPGPPSRALFWTSRNDFRLRRLRLPGGPAVTSEAEQYRRLARELHFMARNLLPGKERSALLKMAEEWDGLADQQEHQTGSAGVGDRHVRKSPRRPVS
jgi:hypothetical protein